MDSASSEMIVTMGLDGYTVELSYWISEGWTVQANGKTSHIVAHDNLDTAVGKVYRQYLSSQKG